MAYTLTQLAALENALASGHLEVQYADKKVKYQDTAEMRKLRAEMRSELIATGAMAATSNTRPTTSVAQFSRD